MEDPVTQHRLERLAGLAWDVAYEHARTCTNNRLRLVHAVEAGALVAFAIFAWGLIGAAAMLVFIAVASLWYAWPLATLRRENPPATRRPE